MPIVNTALVSAGYTKINSIVTTFDSGGDTGRMRTDERGRILAFSDYWRSLISLWKDSDQKKHWQTMLRFRDGRGRNFGNIFFQFLSERSGSLDEVDELFSQLTGSVICGQVIPVSLEPATVCFRTHSGKEYCGEHLIDELRMSRDKVDDIWLLPSVMANQKAIQVISEAEVLIFCPGSIYGSLLVNLLVGGIKKCITGSRALKILMTNLMSTANESHGFDSGQYIQLFEKYLGKRNVIDLVLMAKFDSLDQKILAKVLNFYKMETSFPIRNKQANERVLEEDIVVIEEKNMRLRHSETKLSTILSKLIQ